MIIRTFVARFILQRQNNETPALSDSVQLKCEHRTIRENSTSCKPQLRAGRSTFTDREATCMHVVIPIQAKPAKETKIFI